MFTYRGIAAVLILAEVLAAGAVAAGSGEGPALGKWAFTGKDNTGLVWTGTLSVEKLDPNRFSTDKYHSMCSLEVESSDASKGTRGVEAPCRWDPGTRGVSFTTGVSTTHLYTAVLSADGKSLTQGKWTETKDGSKDPVRSGTWSAKLK
jgi:hypothetical protein